MSQYQAEKLTEIDPQLIALATMRNENDIENEINQLIQVKKIDRFGRPKPEYEKLWLPTPETCVNPNQLPPLQREIYVQILHFQSLEKIDPKVDPHYRTQFLNKFNWQNFV